MVSLLRWLCLVLALLAGSAAAQTLAPPAVTLANVWNGGDPRGYFVSEKFDGVRGYWDGKQLLTRGGTVIQAPAWFTAGWPNHALDGELWAGRGAFAEAVSTVRAQVPDDAAWRSMRYMLFDLPDHPGPFSERIEALKAAVAAIQQPWVQMIEQTPATSAAEIKRRLRQVVKAGGEGLVLHQGDAPYRPGRSDDLLKVKPYLDAEAKVVGHLPGRGKYAGQLGALQVECEDGRRFKLGTGFSDAERRNPPSVGTWITYRYRDLTSGGLPRFASYLRVRADREAQSPQ
ncbi:MAG TPA: DNA ligase [Rhodocyclaceae bacterium]